MDNGGHDFEKLPLPELDYSEPPKGSDRRTFMVRSAMATAIVGELATSHDVAAVMTSPAAIHP